MQKTIALLVAMVFSIYSFCIDSVLVSAQEKKMAIQVTPISRAYNGSIEKLLTDAVPDVAGEIVSRSVSPSQREEGATQKEQSSSFSPVGKSVTDKLAFAGHPLETEDAIPMDPGKFQLEISGERPKSSEGNELDLGANLDFGVINNFDIQIWVPYVFLKPDIGKKENGLSDVEVVGKYLILNGNKTLPTLAVKATVKLPTGESKKGLGSGKTDYGLMLIATKEIGGVTLHINLGYTFVGKGKGEDLNNVLTYSLASELPMTEKLKLVGEIIGETNSDPKSSSNPLDGLVGFIYDVKDWLSLDAAVKWGLSDASPNNTLLAGTTLRF